MATDRWMHLDEVLLTLRAISRKMMEEATHGVCPDCFNDFLSGICPPKKSSAAAIASSRVESSRAVLEPGHS